MLAKFAFENFSGCVAGQFVQVANRLRNFELRQAFAAVFDDRRFLDCATRSEDDHRLADFSPLLVGDTDDRDVGDAIEFETKKPA